MKILVLVLFFGVCCFALQSFAEGIEFSCSLVKYADESGLKTYPKDYVFQILWDKESKTAIFKKNNVLRKMKVADSIDMVSFLELGTAASIKSLSIQKQNGAAVLSIHQFGLSHQAYGNCQLK